MSYHRTLHLGDHFEEAFQTLLAGIHFALRVTPVGFQGEGAVVAILEKRADLAEIVELAVADSGPDHFAVLVLVVAQVDVEDARGVEFAIAPGKALLAALTGVVGVPGEADIVFLDVLE